MKLEQQENDAQPSPGRAFLSGFAGFDAPGLKVQLIFWPLAAAGIALDLWSKAAVFGWLSQKPANSVSVIDGFLQLVLAENRGAAFGIAAGQRYLLITVSIIALVVVLLVFLLSGTRQKLLHIALALFMAGICGNLYDRVFNNGAVRDFIDVVYWPGKHWPAFNVADSMLCIGVGLLIISGLLTDQPSRKHGQQQK
jgi:signal peptidase II